MSVPLGKTGAVAPIVSSISTASDSQVLDQLRRINLELENVQVRIESLEQFIKDEQGREGEQKEILSKLQKAQKSKAELEAEMQGLVFKLEQVKASLSKAEAEFQLLENARLVSARDLEAAQAKLKERLEQKKKLEQERNMLSKELVQSISDENDVDDIEQKAIRVNAARKSVSSTVRIFQQVDDKASVSRLAAAVPVMAPVVAAYAPPVVLTKKNDEDEGDEEDDDEDDDDEEEDGDDEEEEDEVEENSPKRAKTDVAANSSKKKRIATSDEENVKSDAVAKISNGEQAASKSPVVRAQRTLPGSLADFEIQDRFEQKIFKHPYSFQIDGSVASVSLSKDVMEYLQERYEHMCGLRVSPNDKRNYRVAQFWVNQCDVARLHNLCKEAHEGVLVVFDKLSSKKKSLDKKCILCDDVITGKFYCHGFRNEDEDDICDSHFYHIGCGAFLVLCKNENDPGSAGFCCLGMARATSGGLKYGKASRCKPPTKDANHAQTPE